MAEQIRGSGQFGLDGPYSMGTGAIDEDGRLLPGGLPALWQQIAPNFKNSRQRILFTRDVTSGKVRAPVPRKHARNRNVFSPMLPGQILRPMHNHNVLSRKDAKLKRYTSGTGVTALARATRIEQWVNPMIDKLASWDEITGMLQDDGEMAGMVVPAGADWNRKPPPFRVDDSNQDSDILPEWWRDHDAMGIEAYVGKRDAMAKAYSAKNTREAFEEALRDWELDNPEIKVRLIHATDCVPVGLRIDGDGPSVQGLLIRSLWTRHELIRREFIWGNGPLLSEMPKEGPRDVEVLEGWLTDGNGMPYLVYCIQGMPTVWGGGASDRDWAMVDLHKKYGMTKLHAFYEYGWHRSVRDPDMRGMPFSYPTASAELSMQAMVGAAIVNFWSRGHGARGFKIDVNTPREAYMDDSGLRKVSWEPGGDIPILPGEVVDLLPQVLSPDVWRIFDVLDGTVASEGPPPGAFGGEGPGSGRERTVIRRHIEDSQAQILAGSLRMKQKLGMGVLELACTMTSKGKCRPIPTETKIPIATEGKGNDRRGLIVTLDPTDCQRNYSLEAYFEPNLADNLGMAELAKGLVQAGLRPRRWFHEQILGDTNPEQTEAEIVSDHLIYSEEGLADIRQLADQIQNNERSKQRDKLRADGRVSPSGAPLAMAGGLRGPGGGGAPAAMGGPQTPAAGGPGPVGVSLPTSPQGMLGGQVAADLQTGPARGDEQALALGGPA